MHFHLWHLLLLLALICLGLELLSGTFILLSFAIGFAIVAIANAIYDVDRIAYLGLVFAAAAVISGYTLRRWLGPKMSRRSDVNDY